MRKIRKNAQDFKRGVEILKAGGSGEGNKALARQALIVRQLIPQYGALNVGHNLLKQIKKDCKKAYKKGGKELVEAKIQDCVATPEYMQLLSELNMDETHLRTIAEEVTGEKYV